MGIVIKNKKQLSIVCVVCICIAAIVFLFSAIGVGFALAGGPVVDSDIYGIGSKTTNINTAVGIIMAGDEAGANGQDLSKEVLTSSCERDITQTLQLIKLKKEEEAKAEQARQAIEEQKHIAQAKENRAKQAKSVGLPEGLPEINWDQGKNAFMAEWTDKINKYLAGSPLQNYGERFASMAWEYGIDPRWSPAISNTESSKGLHCFAEHNAWGWGHSGWPTWEEAIEEHIKGLIKGYGYTISKPYSVKYCPPNHEMWYKNTLHEMIKMS